MKTPPLKRFSCALALFGCTAFSPAAAFGDFSFGDVDDIDDAVRLESAIYATLPEARLSKFEGYYVLRLLRSGVKPRPFLAKMVPLMRENARIASAFDAVPYNIRYCARAFSFDRSRMEQSMPVLAQINLDGNCFIITMLAMLYVAVNSTPLSFGDSIAVGILVLFLSIGAPNQPGSCLLGLSIVMVFLEALPLVTVAIEGEVFFGGILNLMNIAGDIVTVATEEVRETGSAEKINKAAAN